MGLYLGNMVSNKVFKIPLAYDYRVLTDGAGLGSAYVNNDPSAAIDWSACAGLFDEYRVTMVRVHVVPLIPVNTSTLQHTTACLSIIDETNPTTALTSVAAAEYHADTLESHNPYKDFKRAWHVDLTATNPDDTWNAVGSPVATGAIKWACTINALTGVLIQAYTVQWDVEFRGLGP